MDAATQQPTTERRVPPLDSAVGSCAATTRLRISADQLRAYAETMFDAAAEAHRQCNYPLAAFAGREAASAYDRIVAMREPRTLEAA